MRAIIDIGSNSVRLRMPDGQKTVITTRLGEGLAATGLLQTEPIRRTQDAIRQLLQVAQNAGCTVEAFATEAVRSAQNGQDFVRAVADIGLPIKVLTGTEEALCGYLGATGGKGGVVMDVGGASTEIVWGKGAVVEFSVSLPIGIVRAKDRFGTDYAALKQHVKQLLQSAKVQGKSKEVIGIGGTAISAAAVDSGLAYDRKNTDGRRISLDALCDQHARLAAMTDEQRQGVAGLALSRVGTICGGLVIITTVMEHLGADVMVASEDDNMEGYLVMNK